MKKKASTIKRINIAYSLVIECVSFLYTSLSHLLSLFKQHEQKIYHQTNIYTTFHATTLMNNQHVHQGKNPNAQK